MKDLNWHGLEEAADQKDSDEEENSSSESSNSVSSYNHNIYFYSEVSRSRVLTLNKKIVQVGLKLRNIANTLETPTKSINLHINSYGGSVFAGFAALDYIKGSKVPVNTVINGCAASAATLMSIVGQERYMHEHSFMLIHQLSSWMGGKYEELKDDMKNNELLMSTIKDLYISHTKIPKNQLAKMLKHDLWWDAKTCLKYGLVDDIITENV